jgi:nitrogen fixation protein FixH
MNMPSKSLESRRVLTGRAVLVWVLAFFAVVFAANGVMMTFAIETMSGTEVDSSYRAGMTFNAEVQAARRQDERAWQVDARAARNGEGGAVVNIAARDKQGAPLTGLTFSAALERPTDKRSDRRIALSEQPIGIYRGAADEVAPGQWDLVLEAKRGGERVFFSRTRVFLK